MSERSELFSLPDLCLTAPGTPKGLRPSGRLLLLTFLGGARKVSGCRAAPGKPSLTEAYRKNLSRSRKRHGPSNQAPQYPLPLNPIPQPRLRVDMSHLPGINKLTPPDACPVLRPLSSHPGIIPTPHHNRRKRQRHLNGIRHSKLDRVRRRHQQSARNQPGISSSPIHRSKTTKAMCNNQRRPHIALQDVQQALRPHRQIRCVPAVLLDAFKGRIKALPARLPMLRPAAVQSWDDQHTKISKTRRTAPMRFATLRLHCCRLAHIRPP